MDLSKMTVEQIKSLAYDTLVQREKLGYDLQLIQQELDTRDKRDKKA